MSLEQRLAGKGMPAGWFQIGWSKDLEIGQTKALRYFDTDLVLYRGEDGKPYLFDAYCPHLGANLGYGGCVIGNDIQCPFHGWQWAGADGRNANVPYGDKAQATRKKLRKWHVTDASNTFILAWFHPDGGEPSWDAPQFEGFGSPDYHESFPDLAKGWGPREMHPEWIPENAVDFAHFRFVHKTPDVGRLTHLSVDGPVLRSTVEFDISVYGADGERAMQAATDDLTCYGIGLVQAVFSVDGFVHLQSQTPVDGTHCDLFTTVAISKKPADEGALGPRHMRRFEREIKEVDSDLVIWEHRRMDPHPALAPAEAKPHRTFSTWAKQFYTIDDHEGAGAPIPLARRAQ